MNTDNLMESVQTGFRVAVGATASLIELLQDPQKQSENPNPWNADWNELTKQWAEKGEVTEQEARKFVENLWNQQTASNPETQEAEGSTESTASTESTESNPTPSSDSEVQSELHELTQKIASLRAELEKLQREKGDG
jgi:polyhydroxyalkanoate synthesis regulator phasin